MIYVDVKDLPKPVRIILKRIGFSRKEVQFDTSSDISLRIPTMLRYNRGFCAIVDVANSRYRIGFGSYGGTNQFQKTIVDDCNYRFKIPHSHLVIKGEQGDNGCYATIIGRPDGIFKPNGSDADEEDRIYRILKICKEYSGDKRDRSLEQCKLVDISTILDLGYMVYHKEETLKITKRGKRFIKKYENLFPHKVLNLP